MQTNYRFRILVLLMGIAAVALSCNLSSSAAPTATPHPPQSLETISPTGESIVFTETVPPTIVPSPTSSPQPTPVGGGGTTLFYLSDRDAPGGVLQIYRMELVNRQTERITTDVIEKHNLAVSPDGRWAAFVSGEYQQWIIYVVDLQGSGSPLPVTPEMPNSGLPVWSPDSQWLAFSNRHARCCSAIYIVRPDGSDLTLISNRTDYNSQPTWSPDSQMVGYKKMPNEGTFGGGAVVGFPLSYAASLDGSEHIQLLEMENYMHFAPAWTPDGSAQVIMAMDQMRENYGFFLTDPQGGQPALITPGEGLGYFSEFDVIYTVFSPDGTQIAVGFYFPFSDGDVINYGEIQVMNADGSNPKILHTLISEFDSHTTIPSWTSDSTAVVIEDERQLYLVNVADDTRIPLTDSAENHAPVLIYDPAYVTPQEAAAAPGEDYAALDLQGSGRLAYTSDESGAPEVYILDLDHGTTHRLTRDLSEETHLAWSPDGENLAYISKDQWQSSLIVADTGNNGTTSPVSSLPGFVSGLSWSPDGRQLAVVHQPDPQQLETEILQLDLSSGQAEALIADGGINRFPDWSPDGTQIAFSHRNLETLSGTGGAVLQLPEVHTIEPGGINRQQFAIADDFFEQGPIWNSTGDSLYYIKVGPTFFEIYLAMVNVETGAETILIEKDQFTGIGNSAEYHWMGSWSPDGSKLGIMTFAWDGEADFLADVFVYVYDSTTQELALIDQVVTTGYDGPPLAPPTWAADGSLLLYTGFDLGNETTVIYAADATTGTTRQISDSSINAAAPAWAPE